MTAETHATMDLETLRSSADAACRLMKALSNPDRLLLLDAGRRLGFGTLAELAAQSGSQSGDLEEVFLGLTQ